VSSWCYSTVHCRVDSDASVILWCLQYSATHYSDIATTRHRTNTYTLSSIKSSSESLSTNEHGGRVAGDADTVQLGRPIVEASCRRDVFRQHRAASANTDTLIQ
jgi:hypothetical protein